MALRLDGRRGHRPPRIDLARSRRVHSAMHRAIRAGSVQSCHDLSEGGLAVAAAEMAIGGGLGLALDLRSIPAVEPGLPDATRLYAESPTRFLVEVAPEEEAAFMHRMGRAPYARIGRVLAGKAWRVGSACA